ncbi:ABC transporter substrate-binding protein [Ignatzschineria sp. LJL83]
MKTLLKRSLLLLPLMMSLTLADTEKTATGIVMDFGAVDTLVVLDKAEAISAIPMRNLPTYLKELNTADIQDGGGMKEPNLEVYAELKPEFIVISPRLAGKVDVLSEYAPVLNFTANPEDYYASVSQNILALAKLVDAEDSANVSLNQLNSELDEIKANIAKNDKIALTMMHNADNLFASPTSGYGKFIHHFLGTKNAVKAPIEGRQAIDIDYLNEIQPDVIFIIDRSAAIGQTPMNLESFQSEIISKVTLENGKEIKVVYLDPTLWYLSGNGLMSIELQAKEVATGLQ